MVLRAYVCLELTLHPRCSKIETCLKYEADAVDGRGIGREVIEAVTPVLLVVNRRLRVKGVSPSDPVT